MKKLFIFLFFSSFLAAQANYINYSALINAISRLNVAAVEYELRSGILTRDAKKQLLKVVDELIEREEKNNEWHKNYNALMQTGSGLVMALISFNLQAAHQQSHSSLLGFLMGAGATMMITGFSKFFSYTSSYVHILAIKACILKNAVED